MSNIHAEKAVTSGDGQGAPMIYLIPFVFVLEGSALALENFPSEAQMILFAWQIAHFPFV